MTTRYRVEYQLKSHRRDQFIEWIKGVLAVPFVLLTQSHTHVPYNVHSMQERTARARQRYGQVMDDVESLVIDHIVHQQNGTISRLKQLVPSIGSFFTPLPLRAAFEYQDRLRSISSRSYVAPSFNDVRLILNTAQVMSLVESNRLELITFDGDVTLYDDGECLTPENPCISRILELLTKGVRIAIVTAAGYTDSEKYYQRLYGLLDAMTAHNHNGDLEGRLIVMGGEANFLFAYTTSSQYRLKKVPLEQWRLPQMSSWTEERITALLDEAEVALRYCVAAMQMPVTVVRKERAVGIFPPLGVRLTREQLEETVLIVQDVLEQSAVGREIPFCAFNGGNDIFVDIGDKSWGVRACQSYFGGIPADRSLHVGDQFLSAGANDFKARQAATTCWIASPAETVSLLDEIACHRSVS